MNQKQTLLTGAILGLLGVAFGAFGAHALKNILIENGRAETYELAVRYQFYHALALLFTGLLFEKFECNLLRWAAALLLIGTLLFSGTLYLYSLTNTIAFAIATPFGGVALILGWALVVASIIQKK